MTTTPDHHDLPLGILAERPPTDPVDADLLERAALLRPLLSSGAARCEAERRIPQEHLDALGAAGLFDVIAPKRVGGAGASIATQLAVAAELARGCPSTAWVQTIFAGSRWWVGTLCSDEAQRAVFDPADPPLISGVLGANGPSGTARAVEGGYRVSGRWPFASGSTHASWSILGVAFLDAAGVAVDEGIVLARATDLRLEDTWRVAGMAGTCSNTWWADEVFVPEACSVRGSVIAAGRPDPQEPSDHWPTSSVLTLLLMGTVFGTARQLVSLIAQGATKRGISYSDYQLQVESSVVLREVAHAALQLDTAWLHLVQAAADIDATGAGRPMDLLARARLRGSCGYVAGLLRDTTGRLIDIAGASAFATASPLQRLWRDLNTASRHAFLGTDPMLELYGRAVFGRPERFGPV